MRSREEIEDWLQAVKKEKERWEREGNEFRANYYGVIVGVLEDVLK